MSYDQDRVDFFASLVEVERENSKDAKKALAINAIQMHLPCLCEFHRTEFARKLKGQSYDRTTVSLATLSLQCLLKHSQDKEEKRLLEMLNGVLELFE